MRVLHIISSLGTGGAERLVVDLAVSMVEQKVDVAVAYISSASEADADISYEKYLKEYLQRKGVNIYHIGHLCRRNPLAGGWKLNRIIKHFKPDLIHSHLYYGIIYTILSGKVKKLIYTHHNTVIGKGKCLYPVFNIFVDCYVGICDAAKRALKPYTKKKPIDVIYNAVDLSRFDSAKPRSDFQIISFISIGALTKQKNYPLLIQAVSIFLKDKENPECFHFSIVGDGPERSYIESLVKHYKVQEKVTLLGSRTDVAELMRQSNAFVMTSAWEGLPISLLEAISASLPILTTDVGGNAEIVESGGLGLVVRSQNPKIFADALDKFTDSQEELKQWSSRSYSLRNTFSISNCSLQHLKTYNRCIREES